MEIRILTIEGCPNALDAENLVRELLDSEGLEARVAVVLVDEADQAGAPGFLGSPTVQVDGVDVEASRREEQDFCFSCRVYRTPSGVTGTPPHEMIRAALRAGRRREPVVRR